VFQFPGGMAHHDVQREGVAPGHHPVLLRGCHVHFRVHVDACPGIQSARGRNGTFRVSTVTLLLPSKRSKSHDTAPCTVAPWVGVCRLHDLRDDWQPLVLLTVEVTKRREPVSQRVCGRYLLAGRSHIVSGGPTHARPIHPCPRVSWCSCTALFPQSPKAILFGFCVFEVACGVYFPSIGTLRGRFIPEEVRSTIMNFFRIGLNLIVVVVLSNVRVRLVA
jgi:hypothetical protein